MPRSPVWSIVGALMLLVALTPAFTATAADAVHEDVVKEVVIGPDSRVRVTPTTSAPYSSICRITLTLPDSSWGYGSGIIIGNRWVLTAAHVAYDSADGGYATLVVQPGYDAGSVPYGSHNSGSIYVPAQYLATEDEEYDYALVHLSDPVGQAAGRLPLVIHPDFFFNGAESLEMAGYPGDLTVDCSKLYKATDTDFGYSNNLLWYQCDTYAGDSGGAVLDIGGNVVAVHDAGLDTGDPTTSYNQGTRVNANMIAFLKSHIDDPYDRAGNNETYLTATDLTAKRDVPLASYLGMGVQWDDDVYKITATAGNLRLHVECTFINSEGNIDMSLLDSTGAVVTPLAGNAVSATSGSGEIIDCLVPSAGTYYIRIYGDNMENTYDLVWSYAAMPSVVLTTAAGGVNVTEGGATDTYSVKLSQVPTANVTVTVSCDGNETAGVPSLVFTPGNWSTPQTVVVTAFDDALANGTHTGTITHTTSSADGYYNAGGSWPLSVTVTDNDTPAVRIAQSGGATVVKEGSTTDSYTLVLLKQPSVDVTITITPGADVTLSTTTVTFTSANWNTPQTVTVTANDDTVVNGTRTDTLTHSASSGDAGYNGLAIADVTVTVQDNDAPAKSGGGKGGCAIGASQGASGALERAVLLMLVCVLSLLAHVNANPRRTI